MGRTDNLQSKEAATFSTANIRNISKCLSVQIGEQVTLPCRVQNKKGKQPNSFLSCLLLQVSLSCSFNIGELEVKLSYEPVCPSVCRLVGQSVRSTLLVCYNFKFHFPCSYRSTCYYSIPNRTYSYAAPCRRDVTGPSDGGREGERCALTSKNMTTIATTSSHRLNKTA